MGHNAVVLMTKWQIIYVYVVIYLIALTTPRDGQFKTNEKKDWIETGNPNT